MEEGDVAGGWVRESLERAMGIEPTSEAWEASILPLYDARSGSNPNAEYHWRCAARKNAERAAVT